MIVDPSRKEVPLVYKKHQWCEVHSASDKNGLRYDSHEMAIECLALLAVTGD